MELDVDRRYTPTGVRRAGDDYQDVIGIELLVEWLEHPARYVSVFLEADDAGFLDDIVAKRSDGGRIYRQVKFSAHPEQESDPWTWETLLKTRKGKTKSDGSHTILPSLLGKWASTCDKLLNEAVEFEAEIVSNRMLGDDFKNSLVNGFIVLDRIADESVRSEVLNQIGDEETSKAIFSKLKFNVDQPGLEVLEASAFRRFSRLGGTEFGWLKLNQSFRRWVRNRDEPEPAGEISYRDVQLAAQWFRLQRLPQEFEIPDDYVLPSQLFHEEVIDRVANRLGQCHVVVGTPGVGKSTFASHLYKDLVRRKIPVIRHHYFLSLTERISSRLDHQKAAESLMHDLLNGHRRALGSFAISNPNPLASDLRKWIEKCGEFYSKQRMGLVVILDGLDHVWRERRSVEELRKLVEMLLPCPPGVSVLLAMQPVDDNQLPPCILHHAPRDRWLELPLLDIVAVKKWLRFHQDELEFAEDGIVPDHILDRVAGSLFEKSGGHPLHLRFTIRTLQERRQTINADNINNLPDCPHNDISAYYDELWNSLSEEAKLILHLFASCNFVWPPNGIADCMTASGIDFTKVTSAIKEVSHLLIGGEMGLRPFHGSLVAHTQSKPIKTFETRTRDFVLRWLSEQAPEYWQWAYEWTTKADQGDDNSLLSGPDRKWLINSIRTGRPYDEIQEILARCQWIALETRNLIRVIEVGSLAEYCYNALYYHDHISSEFLFSQLIVRADEFLENRLRANISRISDSAIRDLAESEFRNGDLNRVKKCLVELNDRLRTSYRRSSNRVQKTWKEQVSPILNVAAMCGEPECKQALNFIERNRDHKYSRSMLDFYLTGIRKFNNVGAIRQVLDFYSIEKSMEREDSAAEKLTRTEARLLGRHAVFLGLDLNTDLSVALENSQCREVAYTVIYNFLRKGEAKSNGFTKLNQEVLNVSGYRHHEERDLAIGFFHDTFFNLVANHLSGNEEATESFLESVDDYSWARQFVQEIGRVAAQFADAVRTNKSLHFSWIAKELSKLPLVPWRSQDRTDYEYGITAKRTIFDLSFDAFVILRYQHSCEIQIEDLVTIFDTSYCDPFLWIDAYVERRRCWLDDSAVDWLVNTQLNELNSNISEFMSRAENLTLLSKLAALHQKNARAEELLELAIENLVSHGDHKDMLLGEALEVVSICHRELKSNSDYLREVNIPEASLQKTREWLFELAAPIAAIDEFTNGDHTGHLPSEYSVHLSNVAPEYLPVYYRWLDANDQPNHAVAAFHSFLGICDLGDSVNQAIATTAVDPGSLRILANRAEQNDSYAQQLLNELISFLGEPARPRSVRNSGRLSEEANSILESDDENLPNISDYPPNQLSKFVDDISKLRFTDSTQRINQWSEHWVAKGEGIEVVSALESAFELGCFWVDLDKLFELSLNVHGTQTAFPWLARAHRKKYGWSRYWTANDESSARLVAFDSHYRDRWDDFIKESFRNLHGAPWSGLMIGHNSWVRLLEFCFRIEQPDLAFAIASQMIQSTKDLCSSQSFQVPDWTHVEVDRSADV